MRDRNPQKSVARLSGWWLANVQAQAEAAAQCAVAAAGLLRAMAAPLGSMQYWREYHGSAAPAFLTLLSLIIPQQPALSSQVPTCHLPVAPGHRGLKLHPVCFQSLPWRMLSRGAGADIVSVSYIGI